jgi:hypothetical protein
LDGFGSSKVPVVEPCEGVNDPFVFIKVGAFLHQINGQRTILRGSFYKESDITSQFSFRLDAIYLLWTQISYS